MFLHLLVSSFCHAVYPGFRGQKGAKGAVGLFHLKLPHPRPSAHLLSALKNPGIPSFGTSYSLNTSVMTCFEQAYRGRRAGAGSHPKRVCISSAGASPPTPKIRCQTQTVITMLCLLISQFFTQHHEFGAVVGAGASGPPFPSSPLSQPQGVELGDVIHTMNTTSSAAPSASMHRRFCKVTAAKLCPRIHMETRPGMHEQGCVPLQICQKEVLLCWGNSVRTSVATKIAERKQREMSGKAKRSFSALLPGCSFSRQ